MEACVRGRVELGLAVVSNMVPILGLEGGMGMVAVNLRLEGKGLSRSVQIGLRGSEGG
jgi:hypothetical protein